MIKVYDNLVSPGYREYIHDFVRGSLFRVGGQDGAALETANHLYIYSEYSYEDVVKSKILEALEGTEVGELIKQHKFLRGLVNLSVPSDSNFLHSHHDCTVVLYYVNLSWQADWAGETVFYNGDKTEITKAVNIKPGRVVVFDGDLLHSIRPQNYVAPHYRFTYALVLGKTDDAKY